MGSPQGNPLPTVDVIIRPGGALAQVVLVRRRFAPLGWALPGGFVDAGESLETAAAREAREETGLDVRLVAQLHTYSDPRRDPRRHTITTVYVADADGTPHAGDDAAEARAFGLDDVPPDLCFDHGAILADYRAWLASGRRPDPPASRT
jgi:8-oxo-dGTP diphosphatase